MRKLKLIILAVGAAAMMLACSRQKEDKTVNEETTVEENTDFLNSIVKVTAIPYGKKEITDKQEIRKIWELFENLEKTESTPPEEIKYGSGAVFFITEDGQKTSWGINGEGVGWKEKYYSVKEEDIKSLDDSLREIFGETTVEETTDFLNSIVKVTAIPYGKKEITDKQEIRKVWDLFENLEKTESTPTEEIKVGGGTIFFITENGQKTSWDINGEGVWWQEKYYSVKEEDVDSLCDSLREIFGEE